MCVCVSVCECAVYLSLDLNFSILVLLTVLKIGFKNPWREEKGRRREMREEEEGKRNER